MVLISNPHTLRIHVKDQSYVGQARRCAEEFAEQISVPQDVLSRLSIVVSEMASNLAKHADGGGEILLYDASGKDCKALRVYSIDRGPGIADLDCMLVDGVSSTNTLGGGFGALKRMSDSFEIVSEPGKGTCVLCTLSNDQSLLKARQLREPVDIGYVSVPHPKETRCGDTVALAFSESVTSILLVDGLGHGPEAADTACVAAEVFQTAAFDCPRATVEKISKNLAGSRGAALALVQILHCQDKLLFVGVGNIAGNLLLRYGKKGCPSVQGIVGAQMGNLKEYSFDWSPGNGLLMYSDGLKSSADVQCFSARSASLLAAEAYRDFARGNDDATAVVVKDRRMGSRY